jgi:protein-S-isoprenylcysteine O-methyltransferase Ste14
MRALELRIPPVIVVLAVAICMWVLARVLPALDLNRPVRLLVASTVAAAGFAIAIAGVVSFRRAKTTVNPLNPGASELVSTGVYAFTRNPMYLGMALVLLGWAIYLSSVASLAGPLAFVAYITRYQIIPEERVLAGLFGDRFAEYRARVRRWL